MNVQRLEYVITNASILKDLSSALVWKATSLNPHEPVVRQVMAPAGSVIDLADKLLF